MSNTDKLIPCTHWSPIRGVTGMGACALNIPGIGKRPGLEVCLRFCNAYEGPCRDQVPAAITLRGKRITRAKRADQQAAGQPDAALRAARARSFIESYKLIFTEGEVSMDAARQRINFGCKGIPGVQPPCPKNKLHTDGVQHVCDSCKCPPGVFGTLYVEGKPIEESLREYPRMLMPDPHCPLGHIRATKGGGEWPVIGRVRLLLMLRRAAAQHIKAGSFGWPEFRGAMRALLGKAT